MASCAFSPAHVNIESIGRSDHPAIAGRHCRSGARRELPTGDRFVSDRKHHHRKPYPHMLNEPLSAQWQRETNIRCQGKRGNALLLPGVSQLTGTGHMPEAAASNSKQVLVFSLKLRLQTVPVL